MVSWGVGNDHDRPMKYHNGPCFIVKKITMCVHEIPHQWISMDLIDLPCIFLILLGLAISIINRHVYGWVIRNLGMSMKPSMKLPMKLLINKDLSAALSCTQLHSAALSCTQLPAFCNNGARFAAYTICEYFFVAFFLHGTPGPRWSEMIWNDLRYLDHQTMPPWCFLMIF